MKINTRQAGDILGISHGAVGNLVRAKKLTDLASTQNGKKKHVIILDAKEVRAFKQVYKKRAHYKNIPTLTPVGIKTFMKEDIETKHEKPMNGIMTRLGNIETKLEILIKMWS